MLVHTSLDSVGCIEGRSVIFGGLLLTAAEDED